jgi:hypothetical protein
LLKEKNDLAVKGAREILSLQILAGADWITYRHVIFLVHTQLEYTHRMCAEFQGVIPWNFRLVS